MALAIAMVCEIKPSIIQTQCVCVTANYESAVEMYRCIKGISMYSNVTVGLVLPGIPEPQHSYNIIVGAPKELAAFISAENIPTNNIGLLVLDDADISASTNLVKCQIVAKLKCRKVAVSSVFTGATQSCIENARLAFLNTSQPLHNITNVCVNINGEDEKFAILSQLLTVFAQKKSKILIFANVCLFEKVFFLLS